MPKIKEGVCVSSKINLLENGLDFVSSGLTYIMTAPDPVACKYVVLHLSSGIELVLKERLMQEHYSLIFKDTAAASREKLVTGNFTSIYFPDIQKRLKEECGIILPSDGIGHINNLRRIRNQFEHFTFNGSQSVVRAVALNALSFLLTFIHDHLDHTGFSGETRDILDGLKEKLNAYKEYIHVRMVQLTPELDKERKKYQVTLCPTCTQEALVIDDTLYCRFCRFAESPQNMATLYAENILNESAHYCAMNGGECPVYDCIHCGRPDTFVNTGTAFLCFSCGEVSAYAEISFCTNCGELHNSDEDICEDCWDHIVSKD